MCGVERSSYKHKEAENERKDNRSLYPVFVRHHVILHKRCPSIPLLLDFWGVVDLVTVGMNNPFV